jgi:hypothetical protein
MSEDYDTLVGNSIGNGLRVVVLVGIVLISAIFIPASSLWIPFILGGCFIILLTSLLPWMLGVLGVNFQWMRWIYSVDRKPLPSWLPLAGWYERRR